MSVALRKERVAAGLRQVDVAKRLGRPQSFVSKYENGELRLEVLELIDVCRAIGVRPDAFLRRLEKLLGR
jgi:transcriptional regulator with XRE-family HTH domain